MVMDGDLQDPPEVIPQFVARWREGYDVVYAVRRHRKEGPLKRARLLRLLPDPERDQRAGHPAGQRRLLPDGPQGGRGPEAPARAKAVRPRAADLRRVPADRPAYERAEREAGTAEVHVPGLVGLAIDGLVSFSSYPLRLVTYLGLVTAALALVRWSGCSSTRSPTGPLPRGWASTIVVVLFMGSVQLICLGIIGEYIRLIFLESKGRPFYIVGRYEPAASPTSRPRRPGPRSRATCKTGQLGSVLPYDRDWSAGVADENMAEDILLEQAGPDPPPSLVAARARLTLRCSTGWASGRRPACSTPAAAGG